MTKMGKEYIEKEYEQAIKEYNAALTEDFLRKNVTRNNLKPSCFLSLWLSPTCRLLYSHVLTSFESEK